MSKHEIQVHEVQYLAATNAKIDDKPVVIITIRPDKGSFRPHNLAISRSSGERLLADLKALLSRATVCLLLLALAGLTGCSADVKVETESSRPEAQSEVPTIERSRTAVAIDLFRDQGPVLVESGEPVEMPLDGTLVVEGCLHFHEHLHIYLNEGDRMAERTAIEIIREWKDGECGRQRH